MTARERWRADLDRYVATTPNPDAFARRLRLVLFTESLWAIGTYRFGQYLYGEAPRPLRVLLRVPYELARKLVGMAVGIHLHPRTRIGPGLFIPHYGGIWINPRAELGAHCNVAHGVTIGAPNAEPGAPVLGDRVWVGPGSVVTGAIRIGSRAVIGANSLVSTNLPEAAVAVGVPARVLAHSGSDRLMDARSRVPLPAPPEGAGAAASCQPAGLADPPASRS
jgi:serine O-acetyltransferase